MNLQDYITKAPEDRLAIFLSSLSITNRTPEYYVNWEKVERETKRFELELNTLNYLVGKENIYSEALILFSRQPQLLKAIPSLIASRDKVLNILSITENDDMKFKQLDFSTIDPNQIKDYVDFIEQAGLLDFLQNKAKRSLVDYVYGIEAGLDSNARKNRSGTTMEGILERHVEKIAQKQGLEWKAQATALFIKENWKIEVPVDKSERRFDVAVYSKIQHKVWIIETNYYGGGGSKLKAVAGEFTELSQFVTTSNDHVEFVWVTDGQGWKTAHLPLSEAFGHIVNVFNLKMLKEEFLLDLFKI
ncbi:type II restriction endonuclease [Streptococcus acidominimus]|uniref:Type-2 restriction enzyme n=1 Tax=Streptococcus acidominimus TaxID=1326 RepID=A0A1Q8ECB4_STRAI|nr:type II restriction endonuclease [Streptococcus acidominimus]MBF0847642.1 type II restriction endonuclease [Streptococcus danieliae]MBF0819044.1 type II restriction endonuclease [Streptococcus acidominimus]MBF0837947.1 type II restriction endonuclease [Streptococcus acidominimus]OLF49414.1 restriction endonuclease [Streptococcus acidominimus]TFU30455.1 restriction endonuclease [Streptococcus acidominimus]